MYLYWHHSLLSSQLVLPWLMNRDYRDALPPTFKFLCTRLLEAVFLKHELLPRPSPFLSPAYCCSWVRSMLLSWFHKTLPTSASLHITPPSRCIRTTSVLFSNFIFQSTLPAWDLTEGNGLVSYCLLSSSLVVLIPDWQHSSGDFPKV